MATFVNLPSICIAVASFALLAQPTVAQGPNITLPLNYDGQVLQRDGDQTCPTEEQRGMLRNEISNATRRLLRDSVVPCGDNSGWRRVAYLNMSNPTQQCPSAWQEITTPHRVCGRVSNVSSCEGVTYTTGSEQYDQVCGRIIGYQKGIPYAFTGSSSIDRAYVDGISVTHGSPRQHIWTFAGGFDEQSDFPGATCPCVAGSTNGNRVPRFVGQNYFCETGVTRWYNSNRGHGILWADGDPLWDGQGCGTNTTCCTFNSPPWFNVRLPLPTADDIEVRICSKNGVADVGARVQSDETPIQLIEFYVK